MGEMGKGVCSPKKLRWWKMMYMLCATKSSPKMSAERSTTWRTDRMDGGRMATDCKTALGIHGSLSLLIPSKVASSIPSGFELALVLTGLHALHAGGIRESDCEGLKRDAAAMLRVVEAAKQAAVEPAATARST
jgi:hypothetical protein